MANELLTALGGLLASAGKRKGKIENRAIRVGAEDYDYQIYTPPGFRNEKSLPVIVFLHGIGQRGTGGFVPTEGTFGALVRHYFAQVPAIVLLPQCRPGKYWADAQMDEMTMRQLAQTIEEFGADESRVYLTGVSMGGYGVWHFAARYPEKFAAVVAICGGSPILSGDRFMPIAEKAYKIPAWIFHGADDRVVPASESRQMVEAIKRAGGAPRYSEFAGVGHNVWLNALSEKSLMPWLLEQRLGNAARGDG